jgi:Flp pilus assembly protein TadG
MKKKRPKKSNRLHEKGQSLVELAISLPVILLILLGTFDFGMALFSYSILRDAAQEGALYGSFNPGNRSEIENRARNILPRQDDEVFSSPVDLRNEDQVSVDIKVKGKACQGVTKGVANYIEVQVSYNYPILMPFTGEIVGSDTIKLTTSASNVILQPPCK